MGAEFLRAVGANAFGEKIQWIHRTLKNLDFKRKFKPTNPPLPSLRSNAFTLLLFDM